MSNINLEAATRRFLKENGITSRSMNFGALKLKITDPVPQNVWRRTNFSSAENSATRCVKMDNYTPESGRGIFEIEKKGKPVVTFNLTEGVVKGLPYRVKFPGNNDVLSEFWAPVSKSRSLIQDYNGLLVKTSVPLGSRTSALACVANTTQTYRGDFSCDARLSGNVIVEKDDGSIDTIPIEHLVPTTIHLKGNIEFTFQNNHNISVE